MKIQFKHIINRAQAIEFIVGWVISILIMYIVIKSLSGPFDMFAMKLSIMVFTIGWYLFVRFRQSHIWL